MRRILFIAFSVFILQGVTVAASCDPPLGEAASRRSTPTLAMGTPYRRPPLPAGLSGIAWAGGTRYYAVSDAAVLDEAGLYPLTIELAPDGLSVVSCTLPPPANRIRLAGAADLEAVAFDAANGTVWAADETGGTVKEFRVSDGAAVRTLPLPDDLDDVRPNLGIEALALGEDGKALWTCTEEARTRDGPRSSPTNGTLVRLLKYARPAARGDFTLAETHLYMTDPWSQACDYGGQGRRGVSGLCVLPDGSLLVLERELSFGGSKPWAAASTARLSFAVYHVEAASGGTRSRASVVKKRKLVSGGGPVFTFGNYEGICLGPRLPGGQSVLLVSDAGDGVSQPLILPMVLSSFNPQKE